jgi:hypothetical protein
MTPSATADLARDSACLARRLSRSGFGAMPMGMMMMMRKPAGRVF